MTPVEAIQVLEQVRRAASMNGNDHDKAREAIQTLAQLVQMQEEKKEKEPEAAEVQ